MKLRTILKRHFEDTKKHIGQELDSTSMFQIQIIGINQNMKI